MRRFEYRIVDSNEVPGGGLFKGKERTAVEDYLNSLGAEGWQIINLDFREFESRLEFTGVARREVR